MELRMISLLVELSRCFIHFLRARTEISRCLD